MFLIEIVKEWVYLLSRVLNFVFWGMRFEGKRPKYSQEHGLLITKTGLPTHRSMRCVDGIDTIGDASHQDHADSLEFDASSRENINQHDRRHGVPRSRWFTVLGFQRSFKWSLKNLKLVQEHLLTFLIMNKLKYIHLKDIKVPKWDWKLLKTKNKLSLNT